MKSKLLAAHPIKSQKNTFEVEILAPLKREKGYSPAWITQAVQGIMIPNFVLYIKKESILKVAPAYVEELRDHHLPMLRAVDLHEPQLAHETANTSPAAKSRATRNDAFCYTSLCVC